MIEVIGLNARQALRMPTPADYHRCASLFEAAYMKINAWLQEYDNWWSLMFGYREEKKQNFVGLASAGVHGHNFMQLENLRQNAVEHVHNSTEDQKTKSIQDLQKRLAFLERKLNPMWDERDKAKQRMGAL